MLKKKQQSEHVAHGLLVISTREALRAYYGARRFISRYERSNRADQQELRIRFDVDRFRLIINETAPHVAKMIDYLKRNRTVSLPLLAALKSGADEERLDEIVASIKSN